jgi:hypothetical protein
MQSVEGHRPTVQVPDPGPVRDRHGCEQSLLRIEKPDGCAPYGGRSDAMLTPHPAYTALGSEREARSESYRLLLREALSDDDLTAIRTYLYLQRV